MKEKLSNDLREIDLELIRLVEKRARLTTQASARGLLPGRGRSGKKTDSSFEKQLWRVWENNAPKNVNQPGFWRRLFGLLQEFEISAQESDEDRSFVLAPSSKPCDIRMDGPGDLLQAKIWAVLAAQSGGEFKLDKVCVNDPLVQLIKALNQAGAKLYWEDESLLNRQGGELSFSDKVIFAGDDPFNCQALLSLALAHPGRIKFTGGPDLKLMDLGPMKKLFPRLGARLVSQIPRTSGLPARLESSGAPPDEIFLPDDYPSQGALALAASAPSFANGLLIRWNKDRPLAGRMAMAADLINKAGGKAGLSENSLRVEPGLNLPDRAELDLDPFVCGIFLALPLFNGGRAKFEGGWPLDLARWRSAADILARAGLEVTATGQGVESSPVPAGEIDLAPLDVGEFKELFPLAVGAALARAAKLGPSARTGLIAPDDPSQREQLDELLERIGYSAEVRGDQILLAPGEPGGAEKVPFFSSSPGWSAALALASCLKPGLCLANPGGATELVPNFWRIFNALPKPAPGAWKRAKQAEKESDVQPGPVRKRIRL